jgi:hypothetical protein
MQFLTALSSSRKKNGDKPKSVAIFVRFFQEELKLI